MSDVLGVSPFDPNSPEYAQYLAGLKRAALLPVVAASAAPAAVLGAVGPDPNTGIPLTGAATGMYGFADNLIHGLIKYSGEGLAQGESGDPTISGIDVHLPGAETAEAANQRVNNAAKVALPPMEAAGAPERIAQEAVAGGVSLGVPGVGGLIKGLGPVANTVARILQPGIEGTSAFKVGAALGATAQTGDEIDRNIASQQPPNAAVTTPDIAQPPVSGPDSTGGLVNNNPTTIQPAQSPQIDWSTVPVGGPIDAPDITSIVHTNDSPYTWGHLFGYVAAGLALAGGFVFHRDFRAQEIKFDEQRRYTDVSTPIIQAYDSIQTDPTLSAAKPQVPIPGDDNPLNVAARKASGNVFDRLTTINTLNDFHATDATQAEILRKTIGLYSSEIYQQNQIRNLMVDGVDANTGVSMPPLKNWANRVGQLSEADQMMLDNYAHAKDEMDNRARKAIGNTTQAPQIPIVEQNRVNFKDKTDAELQNLIDPVEQYRPDLLQLHDTAQEINRGLLNMLESSGMISAADKVNLLRDHPNYLATVDITGLTGSPLAARNIDTFAGNDVISVPMWEKLKQHVEDVSNEIRRNTINRLTLENVYQSQQLNPGFAKIFTPSLDTSKDYHGINPNNPFQQGLTYVKPAQEGSAIGVRNNGVLEWHNVHNEEIRNALMQPPSHMDGIMRAASMLARIETSATTQLGAAMVGHVFAPAQLTYANVRSSLTRPQGMASGYLDRAVQNATGGRLGLPGYIDLSAAAGPFIGLGQAGYAHGLHALGELLHPTANNIVVNTLRNMFGPGFVNSIGYRAAYAYKNGWASAFDQSGLSHSAGFTSAPVQSIDYNSPTRRYSPANALNPELFNKESLMGGKYPGILRVGHLAQEVLSIIGDSQHRFMYNLNRDNPQLAAKFGSAAPTMLAYNIRNLTGDMGTKGSNRYLNMYSSSSKFVNVMLQDISNAGRAIKNQPLQTALNVGTVILMPALASVFSALTAGPNSINHMANELTSDQQAGSLRFYYDDNNPDAAIQIPMPQTERVLVGLAKQLAFDILDLHGHSKDADYQQWVMDGLQDLFAKNITYNSLDAAVAGANSATNISLPTAVNGALAFMTGQTASIQPTDWVANGFNITNATRPVNPNVPQLPNSQNVVDNKNDKSTLQHRFMDAVAAMTAIVGQTAQKMIHAGIQTDRLTQEQGPALKDHLSALASVGEVYRTTLRDSLPMMNTVLWSQPNALAARTPLAQHVQDSIDALRPLLSEKGDIRNEGLTRARGMPIAPTPGDTSKVPTDPTMAQAYTVASRMGSRMINGPFAPVNSLADLDKSIKQNASSGLAPDAILGIHNNLIRARNSLIGQLNNQLNDINASVSSIVGHPTTVKTIKWHEGPEQFNP